MMGVRRSILVTRVDKEDTTTILKKEEFTDVTWCIRGAHKKEVRWRVLGEEGLHQGVH